MFPFWYSKTRGGFASRPRALIALISVWVCLCVSIPAQEKGGSSSAADMATLAARPEDLLLKGAWGDPGSAAFAARFAKSDVPSEASAGGFRYHLIQTSARLTAEGLSAWREAGREVVGYVPNNGYFVRVPAAQQVEALRSVPGKRWSSEVVTDMKLSPRLSEPPEEDGREVLITLWPGEPRRAAIARLEGLGAELVAYSRSAGQNRLLLHLDSAALTRAARLGEVQWIEPRPQFTTRNDSTTGIVQSGVVGERPLWDRGLTGADAIIGHIDLGIARNSCYFLDPDDNTPGPSHRKLVAYRGTPEDSGHGTHTAGTAAGLHFSGNPNHAGHAFDARLSHTQGVPVVDFSGSIAAAQSDGAFIHTNSWGDDTTTAYTSTCVDIDTFTWDNENALIVFAATNLTSLRSPENAKNVLAVGATERAPDENQFFRGGAGPTSDGRRKPEIFAPGESIVSAGTATCNTSTQGGTSMAAPAVAASGVLARQYFTEGFYPSGEQRPGDVFVPSGALLKAVLLNAGRDMNGLPGFPSTGIASDGTNLNREGWGRLTLDDALYFEGDSRRLFLQDRRRSENEGMTQGENYTVELCVLSGNEPLKFTLVWNDPPATVNAGFAPINDLDLRVQSPSGTIYIGNVFSGGVSTTGGNADALNNVEMVLLNDPEPGRWTVTVDATTVNAVHGEQGFALVATGDLADSERGRIQLDAAAYKCGDTILVDVIDDNFMGSTVEVTATTPAGDSETMILTRIGACAFSGQIVVADSAAPDAENGTLESNTGDPLSFSYLDVDAGGGSPETVLAGATLDCVAPTISNVAIEDVTDETAAVRFTVSEGIFGDVFAAVTCGSTQISAPAVHQSGNEYAAVLKGLAPNTRYFVHLRASDTAGNSATADNEGACFEFTTLRRVFLFEDPLEPNGDNFTPETNPPGQDGPHWRLLDGTPFARSPDNAYFAPDFNEVQDARLMTPSFELGSGAWRFRFYHTYQFEPDLTEGRGWDGGVLEISTDGGTIWSDLGSHLLEGGYTGAINSGTQNPLSGRQAWVWGELGTMTRVLVDLTPYAGETVRLRFRLGADIVLGDAGWYLDDVALYSLEPPGEPASVSAWMLY